MQNIAFAATSALLEKNTVNSKALIAKLGIYKLRAGKKNGRAKMRAAPSKV